MKVDKQHYIMQHQETDMKYENLISGTICFKCLVKDLREMAFSFSDLVINIIWASVLVIIIIVIIYCQAQGDEVTAMQQPLSLSITWEE